MRISTALTAAAVAGAIAATTFTAAVSADAATPSHWALARADWTKGVTVSAAEQNKYWGAARHQLAAAGKTYFHERDALGALMAIPLTDTTKHQQAVAARETRELNAFFQTPNLYDVKQGNPLNYARSYWITSSKVSAAEMNGWLGAAKDELTAYGAKYAKQRGELSSLEAIPLTDTTAKQRATARRDVKALDTFFHTPGVNA